MKRVGSSADWRTSNRRFPGSRVEPSWFALVASMKASTDSGLTWTWTRVTCIAILELLVRPAYRDWTTLRHSGDERDRRLSRPDARIGRPLRARRALDPGGI